MSTRLIIKLIFVLLLLLFMVMMGMENNAKIEFHLARHDFGEVRAAILYLVFLGAGMMLGAIVAVGWRDSGK